MFLFDPDYYVNCPGLAKEPAPQWYVTVSKIPHRCPVCEGRGHVAQGFYTAMPGVVSGSTTCPMPETCRTCGGSGILWAEA
jgi:hypothetical protein